MAYFNKQHLAQLTDILVDWCGYDLIGDNFAGEDADKVSEEFLRSAVFAFAAQPEALDMFVGLVKAERLRMEEDRRDMEMEGAD